MKKSAYLSSRGVTLMELLISVTILVVILSMAMSTWVSFTQKTNRINAQATLDMEARRIIENFRSEMSKTTRDSIIFFPVTKPPIKRYPLPSHPTKMAMVSLI